MSYDYVQLPPSGQTVNAVRPTGSTARQGPQNDITLKAVSVKSHLPATKHVRDQAERFPAGVLSDMNIAVNDVLMTYDGPSYQSTVTTAPHASEAKVFPAYNNAPLKTEAVFAGVAVTQTDAPDFVRNPLVTIQKSGLRLITNTGPHVIRAGDYVAIRPPSLNPHGFKYRGSSASRLVPETYPFRFDRQDEKDFYMPMDDCCHYLQDLIARSDNRDPSDQLKDDEELKISAFTQKVRTLASAGDGQISLANFKSALNQDFFSMRCAIEKDALSSADGCVDPVANGYRFGGKYMLDLQLNVLPRVDPSALAMIEFMRFVSQFYIFMTHFMFKRRQKRVIGQSLTTCRPGGDIYLHIGKTT